MTDQMTFDNIHYDHIKPVSCFYLDNEEEFLKCCHFTNLQPLLSKDNLELRYISSTNLIIKIYIQSKIVRL
jgi:hypothetical protein